jgi:outer membrane protein OmpA-like peptidoglycan-associated protein
MTRITLTSSGLCALLLSVGCAATAPKELKDARATYRGVSEGPAATATPAELHTAHQALKLAEETFEDEGDTASTRDRAYVAMRKAQLADTQARINQTRHKLETMQKSAEQAQVATLQKTQGQLQASQSQLQEAERKRQEAEAQLAKLADVKQEDRGMVITLSGSVLFASGKSELLPSAQQRLTEVAQALKESSPEASIVVEGHTDSKGSETYNLDLSARRAEAVRSYLVTQGVSEQQIHSQGLGFSRPVADNKSAEGRANNRRVEIVVQPQRAGT